MQKETPNNTQNIVPLRRPTEITGSGVAEVLEVRDGEAVSLCIEGSETPIAAIRHLSHVSALREGDTVTLLWSDIGAIITGRLLREGEHPPMPLPAGGEEAIELTLDRPFHIRVGASRLMMHPDGRILINGREVTTDAEESLRLNGPRIDIN
jgi:hypothetical protein